MNRWRAARKNSEERNTCTLCTASRTPRPAVSVGKRESPSPVDLGRGRGGWGGGAGCITQRGLPGAKPEGESQKMERVVRGHFGPWSQPRLQQAQTTGPGSESYFCAALGKLLKTSVVILVQASQGYSEDQTS